MDSGKTTGKAELPLPQPSLSRGQYFEPLLDEVQAAKLLGLHPKTLQRLARQSTVPAIRIGRYWRFRATSLNAWIDLQSTGQPLTERTQ
jgi:excisionase family DNA binding protein